MTFSEKVKNELASIENKKECCWKAQAYGMLLFGKNCSEEAISLHTVNKKIADLYADLLVSLTGCIASVTEVGQETNEEKALYIVEIDDPDDRREVLRFFGCGTSTKHFEESIIERDCCLHTFLRGAFLSCASITDPNKEYHLEFVIGDANLAALLCDLLNKIGLSGGSTVRKSSRIVYLKESENIEDLLTFMGAVKSSLELMNIKILKDVRNKVNRVTNCETANIEKTVAASSMQVKSIEWIMTHKGLDYLPEELKTVAQLRLENPELSLSELCEISGLGLSRSGMNHRLKKIIEIADHLKINM